MLNSTKLTGKSARIRMIALIAILAISLITWLVCQFAVGSVKLGFPAFLLFFTILFMGTGLFYVCFAIFGKRTLLLVFGAPLLIIGLAFLMGICNVRWWANLIICLVLLVIAVIAVFAFKAPEIVVEVNNAPDAGHKTYAERKKEEAEKPQEEAKPLPEIKSFKDKD